MNRIFSMIKKNHTLLFCVAAVLSFALVCIPLFMVAPGNAIRGQDPGYHSMSPVSTVFVATWHCLLNIYSWTDYKMWLLLLMAVPFLWQLAGVIMKNWKFTFRFPALVTVFLFGIYASQLAPITYMEGNTSMAAYYHKNTVNLIEE